MKCPFCGYIENKVVDSRDTNENNSVRRRRECLGCQRRFTTYETVMEIMPSIIKRDGRREPFNREKVRKGLIKACEKRNVSINIIDSLLDKVEKLLQNSDGKEIRSSIIGEMIMKELPVIDEVAYVRFASVYKQFKDINEFQTIMEELAKSGQRGDGKGNAF